MSSRHESSQDEMLRELEQAIEGLRKHFSGQTLMIDGKEMTAEEIIATLQHQIDLIHKTQEAYAEWQKAAKHKRELLADLDDDAVEALREMVRMQFGEDSDAYRQLVTTPRGRRKRSPEAKARAAETARRGVGGGRHRRSSAPPVETPPEQPGAEPDAPDHPADDSDDSDAN
jgi:hypothetical protein